MDLNVSIEKLKEELEVNEKNMHETQRELKRVQKILSLYQLKKRDIMEAIEYEKSILETQNIFQSDIQWKFNHK